MPPELSQTIVPMSLESGYNCGHGFVNRLCLACQLTCASPSVSLIRSCSLFAPHHAELTADGTCCLIAEGLMHLSIRESVGVQKWKSGCLIYSVEFHQPFNLFLFSDVSMHCTKLRSEFSPSCVQIKPLVLGNKVLPIWPTTQENVCTQTGWHCWSPRNGCL